jgi:DNA-binding transcriptional LysR family regulator
MKPFHMRPSPNHLVVLDALLATHSVSETARRLGLTQSAISHTLRGLREHYGDEILVRIGDRMLPTPLAESLRQPLGAALRQLNDVAATRQSFDPASIERTYVIAMRDLYVDLFAPRLACILAWSAPKASLRIIPWDTNAIEMQLGTGVADLGIGVDPPDSTRLKSRKLFDEHYLCVAAKGVIRKPLTAKGYAGLEHIVVTRTDAVPSPIDKLLAEKGLMRRVAVRVPYFSAAVAVVAQSTLVMTAPGRTASHAARQMKLDVMPLPFEAPKFTVRLVWHERFEHDPLNIWLRAQTRPEINLDRAASRRRQSQRKAGRGLI